jgi:hypothetical protein
VLVIAKKAFCIVELQKKDEGEKRETCSSSSRIYVVVMAQSSSFKSRLKDIRTKSKHILVKFNLSK